MSFLSLARYGAIWGVVLTAVGILCLFVHRGETIRQRTVHRLFRALFILSSINFALACRAEPYHRIQQTSPMLNNFLIRWLIASIFLIPAMALTEIVLMRGARSPERKNALMTDVALSLVYGITVAGTLWVTIVASGIG